MKLLEWLISIVLFSLVLMTCVSALVHLQKLSTKQHQIATQLQNQQNAIAQFLNFHSPTTLSIHQLAHSPTIEKAVTHNQTTIPITAIRVHTP